MFTAANVESRTGEQKDSDKNEYTVRGVFTDSRKVTPGQREIVVCWNNDLIEGIPFKRALSCAFLESDSWGTRKREVIIQMGEQENKLAEKYFNELKSACQQANAIISPECKTALLETFVECGYIRSVKPILNSSPKPASNTSSSSSTGEHANSQYSFRLLSAYESREKLRLIAELATNEIFIEWTGGERQANKMSCHYHDAMGNLRLAELQTGTSRGNLEKKHFAEVKDFYKGKRETLSVECQNAIFNALVAVDRLFPETPAKPKATNTIRNINVNF